MPPVVQVHAKNGIEDERFAGSIAEEITELNFKLVAAKTPREILRD